MGVLAWFTLRASNAQLHDEVKALTEAKDAADGRAERLEGELRATREAMRTAEHSARVWQHAADQHSREKALLMRMLDERLEDAGDAAVLRDRLVRLERHNATFENSITWAVSHINALTLERGALIDRLSDGRGAEGRFPTPQMQWERAGLEAPDVEMSQPPPGPIQPAGIVGGVPIPEGKTAGDVINALREKRERERRQDNGASAEETLRSAAELFEDDERSAGDQAPPASADPFSDIP